MKMKDATLELDALKGARACDARAKTPSEPAYHKATAVLGVRL